MFGRAEGRLGGWLRGKAVAIGFSGCCRSIRDGFTKATTLCSWCVPATGRAGFNPPPHFHTATAMDPTRFVPLQARSSRRLCICVPPRHLSLSLLTPPAPTSPVRFHQCVTSSFRFTRANHRPTNWSVLRDRFRAPSIPHRRNHQRAVFLSVRLSVSRSLAGAGCSFSLSPSRELFHSLVRF